MLIFMSFKTKTICMIKSKEHGFKRTNIRPNITSYKLVADALKINSFLN